MGLVSESHVESTHEMESDIPADVVSEAETPFESALEPEIIQPEDETDVWR